MFNLRGKLAQRKEWLAQLRLRRTFEKAYAGKLRDEFNRMAKVASADYLKNGHVSAHVFHDHAINMSQILISLYSTVMLAFAKRALVKAKPKSASGAHEHKDDFGTMAEIINNLAKRWSQRNTAQISDTTRNRINTAIEEGISSGQTPDEIAAEIESTIGDDIGDWRSDVISATEIHGASQFGSLEAAKGLGIDLKKQWVATNDERTRDDHAAMNDTDPVDMDGTFTVGEDEMQYPGDPAGSPAQVVNCRCVLVYVLVDADGNPIDAQEAFDQATAE